MSEKSWLEEKLEDPEFRASYQGERRVFILEERVQEQAIEIERLCASLDACICELEKAGYRPDDYGGTETAATAVEKQAATIKRLTVDRRALVERAWKDGNSFAFDGCNAGTTDEEFDAIITQRIDALDAEKG